MSNQVEMPGDADEPAAKTAEVLKSKRGGRKGGDPADRSPDEATATSDELDEAQDVTKRGAATPVQHEGDGWAETPAQMRD